MTPSSIALQQLASLGYGQEYFDAAERTNSEHNANPITWTPEQIKKYLQDGINPYPDYPGIYRGTKYVTNPVDGSQEMVNDDEAGWSSGGFQKPSDGGFLDFILQNATKGAVATGLVVGGGAALGAGGAAGAGAGEGAAAGTGIDASTGLYAGESTGGSYFGSEALAGGAGSDTLVGEGAASDPLYVNEPSYLTDPAYWNPMGGTEGLAAPGAEGVAGSTATYGSTDFLTQAASLAKEYGITTASAIKLLQGPAGSSLITALVNAAGRAAPGVIGAVAAKKQADSLQELSDKYFNVGAPSRDRYEASYAPGFTMANDPGFTDALNQSSKATLHGLSVNGNPAGSPNAWAQSLSDNYTKMAYPALQRYREQNANTGGIGTLTAAAPGAASGAINAQGNVFNAGGAAVNSIFNPPKSLAEQLAELKRQGVY